ncbi:MAG: PIG-L family deacetylase [Patescibacteria group bacterium]|jgi:LmbE family N-acetylglucosaminyl deacetylase
MPKNILVVAAHPDDELLGAGATLRRHVENNDQVFVLILGQGALSRDPKAQDEVKNLQEQTRRASEIIGFKGIFFAGLPDNAFDAVSLLSITKEIEEVLAKIKPAIVYTHHEYDLNIDHQLAFQAVLTACRPCNPCAPKTIYSFETLSSTEWQTKDSKQFAPNVYVDIGQQLEKKIQALKCYTSEMREYPHSRSEQGVRILAQYRGLESGLRAAEAFRLIRKIQK